MTSSRWLRLLRTAGPHALILLVCFALLEVGTRLLVPDPGRTGFVVRDTDPERRFAFLPHADRVYETSEYRFTVRTNRFGRRDVEWPAEVMADPRNILFIGDSMVFGYGVDREQAVPTLLESRLHESGQPREVFDFSMVACSLPCYRDLLAEALRLGVAAETLLLGITVGNDFSREVFERAGERPTKPSKGRPAPPPWYRRSAFLDYLQRRAAGSPLVVGSALTVGRWLGITLYDTSGSYIFLRKQTPEQRAMFMEILGQTAQIAATARDNRRKLLIVIFPNKLQVENAAELTGAIYDAGQPNRLIQEQCAALGVPCLDLLPMLSAAYQAGTRPLFFPIDRHHNPTGNQLVAEAIFDFLQRTERVATSAGSNSGGSGVSGQGNFPDPRSQPTL